MNKNFLYIILVMVFIILLHGCGGSKSSGRSQSTESRIRKGKVRKKADEKTEKPEEKKEELYEYGGLKYRSPFSVSGGVSSGLGKKNNVSDISGVSRTVMSPESLVVTGFVSDNDGDFALLSGANEFYVVKNGRLYNEDKFEMIGIAAVIKRNKIILITDDSEMYELLIPD